MVHPAHQSPHGRLDSAAMILPNLLGFTAMMCIALQVYPQIYLNHKLKSTKGLSFTYQIYTVLGMVCYTIYTIGQRIVEERNGMAEAVTLYDVASCVHALLCAGVVVAQNFVYKGPTTCSTSARTRLTINRQDAINMLSILVVISLAFFLSTIGMLPWYAAHETMGQRQHLLSDIGFHLVNFLSLLGIAKVVISLLKYPSQIALNFERKSVKGLSRDMYLLGLVARISEVSQNVMLAYIAHDAELVTGNLPKILNGILCAGFDLVILWQFRLFTGRGDAGLATAASLGEFGVDDFNDGTTRAGDRLAKTRTFDRFSYSDEERELMGQTRSLVDEGYYSDDDFHAALVKVPSVPLPSVGAGGGSFSAAGASDSSPTVDPGLMRMPHRTQKTLSFDSSSLRRTLSGMAASASVFGRVLSKGAVTADQLEAGVVGNSGSGCTPFAGAAQPGQLLRTAYSNGGSSGGSSEQDCLAIDRLGRRELGVVT